MDMKYKKILKRIKREHPESSIKEREGKFLSGLAKGKGVIVETGTRAGYSAIWLARHGAEVHTVDIKKEKKQAMWERLAEQNIKDSGLNITRHLMDSVEFLKGFDKKIDLLFLDSLHTREHIRDEVEAAMPKMADDGMILIHDFLTVSDHSLSTTERGMLVIWS